jgi:CRISPR-associated protein Cas2
MIAQAGVGLGGTLGPLTASPTTIPVLRALIMNMLVTYDVQTSTPSGKRRLRRLARARLDYGQRVQFSVFELKVDPSGWATCRDRLLSIFDPEQDSLRFYYLGSHWEDRVEHHGAKAGYDVDGPLIL